MNVIDLITREQEKREVPVLRAGDTVRVEIERLGVLENPVVAQV